MQGRPIWVAVVWGVAAFLLGAALAGPSQAINLGAAGKLVDKLLHREAPAPDRPPAPGFAGESAPADTAIVTEMFEDILLTPEPYYYQGVGRRDPFVSLVSEEYLAEHEDEALQLSDFVVRGILWGERDRFALVENAGGGGFILREGQRLGRYTVSRIEPDAVLVYTSEFGVGRTERLALSEWKGSGNERNSR